MVRSNLSTIPAGIAWGTSVLFSPFLVPIVTAASVVQKHADPQNVLRWLVIVVLICYRVTGHIHSTHGPVFQSERLYTCRTGEERLLPLCCTLVSMIIGTVLLHRLGAAREIVWAGSRLYHE